MEKAVRVLHNRSHRIIVIVLRVIREALSALVHSKDAEPSAEDVKIQAPIIGAVGAIVGTEVPAVKEHEDLSCPFVKIPSSDPCCEHEHLVRHPLC